MLGPLFTETSGNNEAGPTRVRYDKLLLAAEPQWKYRPTERPETWFMVPPSCRK
jgi:hypothetical protein